MRARMYQVNTILGRITLQQRWRTTSSDLHIFRLSSHMQPKLRNDQQGGKRVPEGLHRHSREAFRGIQVHKIETSGHKDGGDKA